MRVSPQKWSANMDPAGRESASHFKIKLAYNRREAIFR